MFFFDSHSAMVLVGISGGKRTGNGNSFLYSVIVYTDCVCVRVCECVHVYVVVCVYVCGGVCGGVHVRDTCMHHTSH